MKTHVEVWSRDVEPERPGLPINNRTREIGARITGIDTLTLTLGPVEVAVYTDADSRERIVEALLEAARLLAGKELEEVGR